MTKKRKNELIAKGFNFAKFLRKHFPIEGDCMDGSEFLHDYIDAKSSFNKDEQRAFDIGFLHNGSEADAMEFDAWSQCFFDGYDPGNKA